MQNGEDDRSVNDPFQLLHAGKLPDALIEAENLKDCDAENCINGSKFEPREQITCGDLREFTVESQPQRKKEGSCDGKHVVQHHQDILEMQTTEVRPKCLQFAF